ncbi:hypothetical protein AB0P21_32265 [Kribbella sp. NPDC056861]|uniref:hypothetical protein n=1 Tax=Kribbella sp. NPDC056861 TaxID=3154857 RepID=UPI00344586FD
MEAALTGTLTADENNCVRLTSGTSGQYETTPVWPQGYTVQGDPKSFEILDADNKVVAQSGATFTFGGGGGDKYQDTWTEPGCLNGTHLWIVGNISKN